MYPGQAADLVRYVAAYVSKTTESSVRFQRRWAGIEEQLGRAPTGPSSAEIHAEIHAEIGSSPERPPSSPATPTEATTKTQTPSPVPRADVPTAIEDRPAASCADDHDGPAKFAAFGTGLFRPGSPGSELSGRSSVGSIFDTAPIGMQGEAA